jgi:sulfur carrier protein ThiS
MRLFTEKFTPDTKITIEQAENLTGRTIRETDLHLALGLSPECPAPWTQFAYRQADEYGFFRESHPADPDIEGYAAGRPGQIPLLLAMLIQELRTFDPDSGLCTLLAQKGLHRYWMAVQYEGSLLRRAAWHEDADISRANGVQSRLISLHKAVDKLLEPIRHNVDGMQISGMLEYGVASQYPMATVNVLCCSREQAQYWASGPYAAVVEAGRALVNDLLSRATRVLSAAGVEVIDGKWLTLPGYEPLFDSRDICDF